MSGTIAHLDTALSNASEMCHLSADGKAVVYCSTKPGVAHFESGEAYIVFRGDQPARFHLHDDWRAVYTVSVGDK